MPFVIQSNGQIFKGNRTRIIVSLPFNQLYVFRYLGFPVGEVQQFGWLYQQWNTGDANVGSAVVSQVPLLWDRTYFGGGSVPEGTLDLWAYVSKGAPGDDVNWVLYRRT